jgi:ATP-dependent RNA helicase DDX46/PRP5
MTGASVTNKGQYHDNVDFIVVLNVTHPGIYYEHGKEPPFEGPPKLHLLVESNEEYRVCQLRL